MNLLRNMVYCILLAALLVSSLADGATLQVSSDLQSAIDAASSGDTLEVAAGIYGKIVVDKSLNLIGRGAVIRAGGRDACVSINANGVNISGFLVENGFYGIKLDQVRGCRVSNNTVIHCAQPGIALLYSDANIITGNNASFNGIVGEGWYGIYLSNSNHNLIADNEAIGNGAYGINLFPSCNNNTITGNRLQGNMYGLYMFRDCGSNIIRNNELSKNTNSGLDLRFNCTGNHIENNTIEGNAVAGITLMEGSGGNYISKNEINHNSRYGLQIQSRSEGNTVSFNNISESQTGIFLESGRNSIYGNRFFENTIQADDRGSNIWNREYPLGGNLWSDYMGRDEMGGPGQDAPGRDGFGDEPYAISSTSMDRYPVMGAQVRPISILSKEIDPSQLRVGDSIAIKVDLQSRHPLLQVVARAYANSKEDLGYCRLVISDGLYQGSFSTALLQPGSYDIVLLAKDQRGNELQESLGQIKVAARSGAA